MDKRNKFHNLSLDELLYFLSYNQDTGEFIWINNRRNDLIGKPAGFISIPGYRIIKLHEKQYFAHRLAWLYVYGVMPTIFLDHINGIKDDNRICNLRLAETHQNNQNFVKPTIRNKTGFLGVHFDRKRNKFCASICHENVRTRIGYYDLPEDAYEAYLSKKRELHEFCTI